MKTQRWWCVWACLAVSLAISSADGGVVYQDPEGGWSYLYEGLVDDETLDGTWDHENGSDQWDGLGIGEPGSSPGGLSSITEGDVTFARFHDTGDPTQDGVPEPSNRKIYLTHDITEEDPDGELLLTGVTLTFRTRLATEGLLDGEVPEGGDGYYIRDGGKSTFSIRSPFAGLDGGGAVISFAPATANGDDLADNSTGALLMNSWDPSGGQDVDSLGGGELNEYALEDLTDWNEFWVTIQEGDESNEFKVDVYSNGSETAESFVVSGGAGNDGVFGSYLAMGVHSTPQTGAIDVDFFGFKPGIHMPVAGNPAVPGDFNGDGMLDASDIDDLTRQSASLANPPAYDLNADSNVNDADVRVWIKDLFNSWVGDANLDGEFNSGDLVVVLASGKYEADVDSEWTTGDFDGNGRTNSGDLVAALSDGGYEAGPRAAVAAVPEPGSVVLLLIGLVGLVARRRP